MRCTCTIAMLKSGSRKVTSESNACPVATRLLDRSGSATRFSFIVEHFSPYAKLLSLFGCFFILNFSGRSLDKVRVTWRNPYTLYAISWAVLLAAMQAWTQIEKTDPADVDKLFTSCLLASVLLCWIITSIVNVLCMVFGSTKLLELFRKATLFEAYSGMVLVQKNVAKGARFRMLRKASVTTSAAITLGFCMYHTVDDSLKERGKTWGSLLPKMLLRLLAQAALVCYEGLMYITVSNVCEVFILYIMAQEVALCDCQRLVLKQRLDDSSASLIIETIRKNLSTIRMLKDRFNDIWTPAILASTMCFVWVHCITWYCLFTNEAKPKLLWLGLAYSGYNTLRFLDLAAISQQLSGEARSVRNAAERATFIKGADSYMQQIQFLHDTIDPNGMHLNGAEFFCLDKGLLVLIADAVITYTVILVQTNDGISSRNDSNMNARM